VAAWCLASWLNGLWFKFINDAKKVELGLRQTDRIIIKHRTFRLWLVSSCFGSSPHIFTSTFVDVSCWGTSTPRGPITKPSNYNKLRDMYLLTQRVAHDKQRTKLSKLLRTTKGPIGSTRLKPVCLNCDLWVL
jgi:hypothetical protein